MKARTKRLLKDSIILFRNATDADKKVLLQKVREKLNKHERSIKFIGVGFAEDTIQAAKIFLRIFEPKETDLLENYHLLPESVQAILLDFNEEADNLHTECKETIQRLEKEGYTADYDLSGTLFDLKKI